MPVLEAAGTRHHPRLRYAMLGGGPGAMIAAVHRRAAELDGLAELVAGAFSSDAERSRGQGAELALDPERVYASYEEILDREDARPEHERIDFVWIVTPNQPHRGARVDASYAPPER